MNNSSVKVVDLFSNHPDYANGIAIDLCQPRFGPGRPICFASSNKYILRDRNEEMASLVAKTNSFKVHVI